MVEVLTAASYRELILPIVDFVEPYQGIVSEKSQRQSYRFTDREGELISVRSDFTPMVARSLSPALRGYELPIRLFYRGDVIRCERSRIGRTREFFQVGAEIVGSSSLETDVDILTLAGKLALSAGIQPLITYTDATLVPRLIGLIAESEEQQQVLWSAMREKRIDLLGKAGKGALGLLLGRIARGGAVASDVLSCPDLEPLAERLVGLEKALSRISGTRFVLALDDVDDDVTYYSGLRFRLFSDSGKVAIGGGGRYDTLYRRFGPDTAAAGFTLSVDYLEEGQRGRGLARDRSGS